MIDIKKLYYKIKALFLDHNNPYDEWTPYEIGILLAMHADGYSDATIGEVLYRSESAIYQRRMKLAREARKQNADTN